MKHTTTLFLLFWWYSTLSAMHYPIITTADQQIVKPTQTLMGHSLLLHQVQQQQQQAVTVTAQSSTISLLENLVTTYNCVHEPKLLHDYFGINLFAMCNATHKEEQQKALEAARELEMPKLLKALAYVYQQLHPINPTTTVVASSGVNFAVDGTPIRSLQFVRNKNIFVITKNGQARLYSPQGKLLGTTGKRSLFLTDDDLQKIEGKAATPELLEYCSKYKQLAFDKQCTTFAIHHNRDGHQEPQRTNITLHTIKDGQFRHIHEVKPEEGNAFVACALSDNGDRLITLERAHLGTLILKIRDTQTYMLLNSCLTITQDQQTFPTSSNFYIHIDKNNPDVVYINTEDWNTVDRTHELYKGTFYTARYNCETREFKIINTQDNVKFFKNHRTIIGKDFMPNHHNAFVVFKDNETETVERTITGFPQTVSVTARHKNRCAFAAGNHVYLDYLPAN